MSALTACREKLSLNQREFAAKIGVSPQYVNDLERERRQPSTATAEKILSLVKVDAEMARALFVEWYPDYLALIEKWGKP